MTYVTVIEGKKDSIPLPLVFILLFYSGTIIALQNVFPALKASYPQTIFAGTSILLAGLYLCIGKATFNFERVQKVYIAYCIIATIGLFRSAEVGWLVRGGEIVSIIWKHLIFLMILVAFTRTLSAISFARTWILITVVLFVLHSVKAIASGYCGLAGRFDNYVGLISNSDYIGVFVAVFAMVFLHVASQTPKIHSRLLWFALGVLSLIIMVKTQTRAAVLVLGILVPYWIFITSSSKTVMFRKGIVMLLIIGTVVVVGSLNNSQHGSYFDRISTITKYDSSEADFNTKSRLFMWKQGIAIGLANPLLGVGSGATTPYLNLEFEGTKLKDKESKIDGFSMHNTFIQILAERGITGLMFFCLMLFYAYKNLTAVARYVRGQPEKRQLAILADVGRLYFVGYSVGAMFISIDYDWTLFAFVGLSVSVKRYVDQEESLKNFAPNPFTLNREV